MKRSKFSTFPLKTNSRFGSQTKGKPERTKEKPEIFQQISEANIKGFVYKTVEVVTFLIQEIYEILENFFTSVPLWKFSWVESFKL